MMTIKKIDFLLKKGENIKYHYTQYTHQRRLVIDQVEKFNYLVNSKEQTMAKEHVDLLY